MEINKISYHDVDLLYVSKNILPHKLDENFLQFLFNDDKSNILTKDIQFNFIMANQPFSVYEKYTTGNTIINKLIVHSTPVLIKSNECYFVFEGIINKNCILRTLLSKPIIIKSCVLTLSINLSNGTTKQKKYFYGKHYYSKYRYLRIAPIQKRPSLKCIYET